MLPDGSAHLSVLSVESNQHESPEAGVDGAGRVVGGYIYYDQASLLTQLGHLPQPSGA